MRTNIKKLLIAAIAAPLFFASCTKEYSCDCEYYEMQSGTTGTTSFPIEGTRASAQSECAGATSNDPNITFTSCTLSSDSYYDSY